MARNMAFNYAEAADLWLGPLDKGESIRREIIASSKRVTNLEKKLNKRHTTLADMLGVKADYNSELTALAGLWSALGCLGSEHDKHRIMRMTLRELEVRYIHTKMALTWCGLGDEERDFHMGCLKRLRKARARHIAEFRALL